MKEGSLSSDLQERYGISDKDAVGKVLWHSLDDDGKIGVYDMKFGDIIIRNLTEADLKEGKKKKTHEHKVQKEDDEKRARAKLEEE